MLKHGFRKTLKKIQNHDHYSVIKFVTTNEKNKPIKRILGSMPFNEKYWLDADKEIDFNPLERFIYHECTLEEKALDMLGNPIGDLFEYIVAVHMNKPGVNVHCVDCGKPNVIKWNGGGETSFQDLRCTNPNCNALYEIKAKKNWHENKKFPINGGSYCRFQFQRQSRRYNHYLVVVDRNKNDNRFEEHQVYC